MKGHVRVLASPAVAVGFRLAGLPADEVTASSSATTQLQRMVARPDTAVILVEESLLAGVAEAVRASIDRRALPIVVPIPTVVWEEDRRETVDYILDMLQRAIGYRVRLR